MLGGEICAFSTARQDDVLAVLLLPMIRRVLVFILAVLLGHQFQCSADDMAWT